MDDTEKEDSLALSSPTRVLWRWVLCTRVSWTDCPYFSLGACTVCEVCAGTERRESTGRGQAAEEVCRIPSYADLRRSDRYIFTRVTFFLYKVPLRSCACFFFAFLQQKSLDLPRTLIYRNVSLQQVGEDTPERIRPAYDTLSAALLYMVCEKGRLI